MASLVFVVLLTCAPVREDSAPLVSSEVPFTAPRAYHEINRDLRDAMKRESLAESKAQRSDAIYDLVDLYGELKHDPRLETAPTLQQYKAKLWSRLVRVKNDLRREIARAQTDDTDRGQLPQASRVDADAAAAGLASQLAFVSYSLGGPGQVLADTGGAFGGGAVRDYGADLVALIERTIAPDSWDVNGGPGSIVYYAPLQVLVVRATSEVHQKIGGAVGGIRAAGR